MRARLIMTALAVALLTGCQGPAIGPSRTVIDDPMASAPPVQRGLDAQGLATLLTAELAGQRGDFARATRGYLDSAERYGAPALAERAVLAARYSNDPQLLADAAQRWRELAPDAEAPTRLLAAIAMERGDWQASLEQRLALAEQGGQGELAAFAEAAIEAGVAVEPLLVPLRRFLNEHPRQGDALLATALLEAAAGETRLAARRLEALEAISPDLPALWLMRARLALEADRLDEAREAARRGLEIAPEDSRFVLLLAQSQLRLGNVDAAEARIDTLLDRHPNATDLRLALAQLYLDEGHPAPARRLALPLIDDTAPPALAYILLGNIAEREGEVDNALLYYRQVPPGDGFLEARLHAARALVDADRLLDARDFLRIERLRHPDMRPELAALEIDLLDELGFEDAALQLLDQQLREHPDDTQLRLVRAMRHYDRGDIAAMEQDLRHVIELEPDNAMALNALGYTLVDVTERHAEGMRLIQRAHVIEPDSPAILDSLGWAYHKLGDDKRALPLLRQAYRGQPDQEIAAHLAEVLWQLEQKQAARDVIAEAMQRQTDHPRIDELLERIPELAPGQ
ncbi:tetratricopeptide repeat protein [Halomonas sp. McH1-25]|uniref:tetratricopeptide repeat protein n=1 Tax=unclassified Halomonas TaxID=2609666 RepID=UPI001EF5EC47|nr:MULTISPECIES: tetratricopeptide repeat protein [unclassified Halomonas]MCG7599031.1 tetratricopeptide repeat protein [Halomonas sp. McH1-25]MCP1343746.1 tetratricopeptide repeat protein [Halomonas sp. FL8]MCP1360322.1 tetratricopeptide repeat protein [Halomonas sp. BBD45]